MRTVLPQFWNRVFAFFIKEKYKNSMIKQRTFINPKSVRFLIRNSAEILLGNSDQCIKLGKSSGRNRSSNIIKLYVKGSRTLVEDILAVLLIIITVQIVLVAEIALRIIESVVIKLILKNIILLVIVLLRA